MTAVELIQQQLATNERMLAVVLADLPDEALGWRLSETRLSIRETMVHLAETVLATRAHREGHSYRWGTHESSATTAEELLAEWKAGRDPMLTELTAGEDLETISNYFVLHEAYHIGQLAATREEAQAGWSSFALYS